jgi:hypothetical protein
MRRRDKVFDIRYLGVRARSWPRRHASRRSRAQTFRILSSKRPLDALGALVRLAHNFPHVHFVSRGWGTWRADALSNDEAHAASATAVRLHLLCLVVASIALRSLDAHESSMGTLVVALRWPVLRCIFRVTRQRAQAPGSAGITDSGRITKRLTDTRGTRHAERLLQRSARVSRLASAFFIYGKK